MPSIRRILCATDFSDASAPALAFAVRLARSTKARLSLLHVVPFVPLPIEGAIDAQTYQQLLDDDRRDAVQRMEALARDGAAGVPVDVHVEDGPPAPRILEVAERDGADLVVVGTHGRTGLDRLLLGSVAEHVVQLARQPVITVRPLAVSSSPPISRPRPTGPGPGSGRWPRPPGPTSSCSTWSARS
jgi:nucleotide-binding universal stress UspA family protein